MFQIELGTAFEMLVSDPGVTRLANQPEIMRVKTVLAADVEKQFNLPSGSYSRAEIKESDLFQYQRQIASLGAKSLTGMSSPLNGDKDEASQIRGPQGAVHSPLCSLAHPSGRYVVVAGQKVLHKAFELPYNLASRPTIPYPVVEFADTLTAGQFWPTTMVEQLTPSNRSAIACATRWMRTSSSTRIRKSSSPASALGHERMGLRSRGENPLQLPAWDAVSPAVDCPSAQYLIRCVAVLGGARPRS
jgi:hypothetical protein